ncbi:MAG: 50S ribosomal protein L25 [Ignavibacteria bacterium]|nr:50S ribosomal protein L25 [Ignavibacteria bacterium]
MAEVNLKVQKRTEFKKSLSKDIRKKGFIPGVFYGHGVEPTPILASETAMKPLIYTSESRVINLSIEGEDASYSCIIKDIQFDPLKNRPIHFDLLALTEGEKINLEVNVILKGSAIGVKDGGVLQHTLHKLEIECLPQNIPPQIEVDITNLSIGDSVKAGDIKLEGIEILNDANASVVSVVPPTIDKEAEAAAAAAAEAAAEAEAEGEGEKAAEPEVIAKGKKEEEK